MAGNGPQVPGRKAGGSDADVKQLTEEDLSNYTIFDVILPLAGWNVEYPGGACGEMYEKILRADGLDPNRMKRDQRCAQLHPPHSRAYGLTTGSIRCQARTAG